MGLFQDHITINTDPNLDFVAFSSIIENAIKGLYKLENSNNTSLKFLKIKNPKSNGWEGILKTLQADNSLVVSRTKEKHTIVSIDYSKEFIFFESLILISPQFGIASRYVVYNKASSPANTKTKSLIWFMSTGVTVNECILLLTIQQTFTNDYIRLINCKY